MRSDGPPASYLKLLHAFRSPLWRTKNRLDNNGTLQETVEKSRAGIRESPGPGRFSLFLHFQHELLRDSDHFFVQRFKGCVVCRRETSNDNIYGIQARNDSRPSQLFQAPSETVSFNNGVSMLGHDHRHPGMRKQGVGSPNIEVFSAYPSPCFFHQLEI